MERKAEEMKKLWEKNQVALELARRNSGLPPHNPSFDINKIQCSCPDCSHITVIQCEDERCPCCSSHRGEEY